MFTWFRYTRGHQLDCPGVASGFLARRILASGRERTSVRRPDFAPGESGTRTSLCAIGPSQNPTRPGSRAVAGSVQFDLDVDAGGQIELHQRVHGLVGRIDDIHQTLVRTNFILIARILVDVR